MDQMNVSITPALAGYVKQKVKSGRYKNASEVVREALRMMEDQEARSLRLAEPTVEDLMADLSQTELDQIRGRVRTAIAELGRAEYTDYSGPEGLRKLNQDLKASGRAALAKVSSKRR